MTASGLLVSIALAAVAPVAQVTAIQGMQEQKPTTSPCPAPEFVMTPKSQLHAEQRPLR
jgi:hypothetical protein